MKIQSALFSIITLAAMTTYSCSTQTPKSSTTDNAPDAHTAQTALDWQGSYSGVLPCADCGGIETELTLKDDLTYRLTKAYLGKEPVVKDTLVGTFSWEGSNIKLTGINEGEGSPWYKVEENKVRHLDLEGNTIKGELANRYILTKNGNPLVEDKTWRLVELEGQPITESPENHYLIFHSKEGRIEAKANCNVLALEYKIKNELMVYFGQGLTTLMACPDSDTEQRLLKVLSTVDNLSTDGKTLSLNKARMAPLAKFELVETK